MLYNELRDHHNVMATIRPASRGLHGNARGAVNFGYSHVVNAKRYNAHGTQRDRSGTLLMTGGATILCRIH
jgi:hypothetical protein